MGLRRYLRWIARIERRHILHLEREVATWQGLYREERQRAEVAINVCRQSHQGVAGVPVASMPPAEDVMARALEDLLHAGEAQAVGNPLGVEA